MSRFLLGGVLLPGLLTLAACADTGGDELEQNRRLLKKYQSDPELYAKLRRTLKAFLALPEVRQKQLRQLDQELSETDSATQARLRRVLERYADWLHRLPEADRRKIESEPDFKKRLVFVKQLKDREWIESLPKAVQEDLASLPADKQPHRIAELRKLEQARRQEWRVAIQRWDELNPKTVLPPPLAVLTPELISFVNDILKPMLTPNERARLTQAEGKWPLYPRVVVELADKHPVKLPGPSTGPAKFAELPPEVKKILSKVSFFPSEEVRKAEGKWPEYAQAVTVFFRTTPECGRLPVQLGPCKPPEFSPAVQEFLKKKLLPAMNKEQKDRVTRAEGFWPNYPRILLELSRRHGLQIPGMALPGSQDMWNKFRPNSPAAEIASADPLPDLPDEMLLEFVRNEMSDEERADLPSFSLTDPVSRDKAKELYFKKNPQELQRRRQADAKANLKARKK